jgi:hypothetical protein
MPRARRPLSSGEFLPDKPKRGRPITVENEWRQLCAIREVIRRMIVLGEGRDSAIRNTAMAKHICLSEGDIKELYLANVHNDIYEVAHEQILLKEIDKKDALTRIETILGGLEKYRDAQKKKRKR